MPITNDSDSRPHLHDFSFKELTAFVVERLGERPFRAKQIFEWLYKAQVSSIDEMTNLSLALREKLNESCRLDTLCLSTVSEAEDGTTKLQFTLRDGSAIESVLIPAVGRNTLCVSSQVGCAMRCAFCYTGSLTLQRSLTASEIIGQYLGASRHLGPEARIGNVVFMGMGEPLANLENVLTACELLIDQRGFNLASRHVTVSTCGLVTKIAELAERSNVNLAVSLNATTDAVRSSLMPVNKHYPLAQLVKVLEEFPAQRRKRIYLEYVLLKGLNDTPEDAKRLVKIARRIGCKVNLIPFNPHAASPFMPPEFEVVLGFQAILLEAKVTTLIRQSRGKDIHGACGMLGKVAPVGAPFPDDANDASDF